MAILWPVDLPQKVQLSDFSELPGTNVIETQFSTGVSKVRRRSTKKFYNYNVSLKLTSAQVTRFETFFDNDTKDGSLSFQWIEMRTGAVRFYRFVPGSLQPISPLSGSYFNVSFALVTV